MALGTAKKLAAVSVTYGSISSVCRYPVHKKSLLSLSLRSSQRLTSWRNVLALCLTADTPPITPCEHTSLQALLELLSLSPWASSKILRISLSSVQCGVSWNSKKVGIRSSSLTFHDHHVVQFCVGYLFGRLLPRSRWLWFSFRICLCCCAREELHVRLRPAKRRHGWLLWYYWYRACVFRLHILRPRSLPPLWFGCLLQLLNLREKADM